MGDNDTIYHAWIYEIQDWTNWNLWHVTDGNGDYAQSTDYPKTSEGARELIAELESQKEQIELAIKKLKSYI
jgi:hypothetical protein